MKIIGELEASLKRYPPIKAGTPDPYTPAMSNCSGKKLTRKGTTMTTVTLPENDEKKQRARGALSRRHMLLTGTSALAAAGLAAGQVSQAQAQPAPPPRPAAAAGRKPNILVIFGDDIGLWNVSAYNRGMMGYRTPNIDRIAKEGAIFTDYYAQQILHGRARRLHHRPVLLPHRAAQGRPARRQGRPVRQGPDASPSC